MMAAVATETMQVIFRRLPTMSMLHRHRLPAAATAGPARAAEAGGADAPDEILGTRQDPTGITAIMSSPGAAIQHGIS